MNTIEPSSSDLLQWQAEGMTYDEIGKMIGMKAEAVRSRIRRARQAAIDVVHLDTPLSLVGDYVIVGDVHIPCTDWKFAEQVGRVAEKTGVRSLIIAGDFLNMDMWSRYQSAVTPITWREERDAARVLLADWLELFDVIYTLQGNHERRLQKWAEGQLDERDIWGMIVTNRKLIHSNRGWCTVRSGGQAWRVTHPVNYGRNQLTVASDLANKYQSNIISWHEHHTAQGWDTYGRWVTVNGGTLADPAKLAYVALDDSRAAGMINSFVVLRNGVAQVFGKYPFTDWSWLCDN